jgi:AcrR family transcriptional regulator
MRSDARAKRQSLIAAARRLFAEQGPDVPLSSIAAEAEVGIATLYRHFPTRADLIYAIAEELCGQAVDTANKCQQAWDADPDAAWMGFVRALAEVGLSALVTQLAVAHVLESLPAHAVRLREQAMSAVEAVVVKAKAADLVDESLTSVRLLTGLAAITRPLPQFPPARLPDERQWLIDTYIRGLRRSRL